MSKNLIVYAHPYDKSFNHAILAQVQDLLEKKGQTYELIDLYEDGFNPVYTKEELALFNKGQALDPLVLKYHLHWTQKLIAEVTPCTSLIVLCQCCRRFYPTDYVH